MGGDAELGRAEDGSELDACACEDLADGLAEGAATITLSNCEQKLEPFALERLTKTCSVVKYSTALGSSAHWCTYAGTVRTAVDLLARAASS